LEHALKPILAIWEENIVEEFLMLSETRTEAGDAKTFMQLL
jgi:hypothetical protein